MSNRNDRSFRFLTFDCRSNICREPRSCLERKPTWLMYQSTRMRKLTRRSAAFYLRTRAKAIQFSTKKHTRSWRNLSKARWIFTRFDWLICFMNHFFTQNGVLISIISSTSWVLYCTRFWYTCTWNLFITIIPKRLNSWWKSLAPIWRSIVRRTWRDCRMLQQES